MSNPFDDTPPVTLMGLLNLLVILRGQVRRQETCAALNLIGQIEHELDIDIAIHQWIQTRNEKGQIHVSH